MEIQLAMRQLVVATMLLLVGVVHPKNPAEVRALLAAGQKGEAEAAARSAVERLEGTTDPALPGALDLLVEVLLAPDRAADGKTVELAERAVALRRAAGGSPSDLAASLTRLGEALTNRGELERAAVVLTEAEATVPADDARGRARVLNRLAAVQIARGDLPEAARLYAAALAYAAQHQGALDLALSLATELTLGDPTLIAATWDAVIRSRGLVLDEMVSRRRWLSTPDNAALAEALRVAADRLSRLLVEGGGGESADEVETARRELEVAERALAEASPLYARDRVRSSLGLGEVVSSVPPGSALVAYARFLRRFTQDPARRHETQKAWYLAFLRTPVGTVQVLPLADAVTVERLAREWRAAAGRSTGGERAAREAGERLRELIWDPVAARIGGAERVFLVPDGELALLTFAALPTGPDSFLVEQGSLLAVLGQERDLVPDPLEASASACLLALGDPDFEAAPGSLPAPDSLPAEPSLGMTRATPADLGGTRFAPLPGTAEETGAVADLWHRADPRASALWLTGDEASEAAFKALAPGFRVLHLATHGFFLDGTAAPLTGSGRGVGGLVPAGTAPTLPASPNPLQLSGLALAGANRRDSAAAEDGILTAEEVAVLDLSGVEWAVLSACESGVGEASSLEGVFGLRRAFRVAGARTVIMSLWAVDDQAAREWMTAPSAPVSWSDSPPPRRSARRASRCWLRDEPGARASTPPPGPRSSRPATGAEALPPARMSHHLATAPADLLAMAAL